MINPDWVGRRVAVLGYGVEGQSSVDFLLQRGAHIQVHDQRVAEEMPERLAADRANGVDFKLSTDAFKNLSEADCIVRSPGVQLDHPGLVGISRQKITSQTAIFLEKWSKQCIGVTGTKGKGTTSSLLAHILQSSGRKVLLLGNIGQPMLDHIDDMDEQTLAVLELSSYQLQDLAISPHIAIVLMVEPDHLTYHGSAINYIEAKRQIVAWQQPEDVAIVNTDYVFSKQIMENGLAAKYAFGHQVDVGAEIAEDSVWLKLTSQKQLLVRLDELILRGRHNLQNVAAAGLAAYLLGIDIKAIRQSLVTFQPLPHRLEKVAEIDGIVYYNDSFATTPESAAAAVASFDQPLVVILGGSDKQSDFTPLIERLELAWQRGQLCGLVIIGRIADSLAEKIKLAGIECPVRLGLTTMTEMVAAAQQLISERPEGVILLSPGAASFGLFADYKDRGNQFRLTAQQASAPMVS